MSLYVREAGPCDAPAVLFLHGLGLSGAMWQPQFERLADDYHCLAPDLPECENSAASGTFPLKDASRRVADVIRERVPGRSAHKELFCMIPFAVASILFVVRRHS